jgi:DNA-binding NtrC family response regulator
VADAIHELSPRRHKPLIKVNCGAIPETLLDSEMFGHAKGAFTGAFSAHAGFFEQADGGTIFLDEIGEMSLSAQTRLLRVLEQGSLCRVGGSRPVSLDIRVVAATHDDLPEKARAGTFRKDLWYRLAGFPVKVPSLRDRRGDIPALVHHFVRAKGGRSGRLRPEDVPPSALDPLYDYDWPGNVRELEHVVERALVLSQGGRNLRFETGGMLLAAQKNHAPPQAAFEDYPSLLEMENRYIRAVLEHCRGRMTGKDSASAVLGIHYTTLRERMRRMGIAPSRGGGWSV